MNKKRYVGFVGSQPMLLLLRQLLARAYRPAEGGERACNSAYACTVGEMLAVTKNRTKCVDGWQGSCAVCVDLQAVGALEFFGELYSLAKGFGPFLRGFGQALEKGRVLFLVTASISPSVQAYAELHALSPPPAGRYALAISQASKSNNIASDPTNPTYPFLFAEFFY